MAIRDPDLDRLYQLPPSEFIAERNALAKRAGAQGADIRALPKPTLAVWAVNQLYWREPGIYAALVEAAENLRATHRAVMRGGQGDLRSAAREHEAALEAALKAALGIAAEGRTASSDAVRQTIGSTLRALPSGDPPGRLRQALTPGGFEILAGLPARGGVVRTPAAPALAGPAAKTPADRTATPSKGGRARERARTLDKAALARARKAVAAAERTLASAEHAARREEFEAARAARETEQAERRAARAREALAAAQSEVEEAEEIAQAAKKKRYAARSRAAAAEAAAAAAREQKEAAQRQVREIETGR